MYNPFRPKHPCDCQRPKIKARILKAKLQLNSFATFNHVQGRTVQADWQQTDQTSLSYINNKPVIASNINQAGLATTALVKHQLQNISIDTDQSLDIQSTNPVQNKVIAIQVNNLINQLSGKLSRQQIQQIIAGLTGQSLKLGASFQLSEDSLLTGITENSTITEAIMALDRSLTLASGGASGQSVVQAVQKLQDTIKVLQSINKPTIIEGVEVQQGDQITKVEPTVLQSNKFYLISNGFSGQLPSNPANGTLVTIAFSKGSQAMSVFTIDGSSIGYISQQYGPRVTQLYIGVTQQGLLNTSTKYQFIYEQSNNNWIIL